MSKALAATFLFLFPWLSFGDAFTPSSTGYYSQAQFASAVAQAAPGTHILPENFTNGSANLPGVSVSSDIDFNGYDKGAGQGHFTSGAYLDTTEKYSITVWSFNQPIYAFGGNWNLGTVNAGLEINAGGVRYFMPDAYVPPLSSYNSNDRPDWPTAQWSGFWGFVSTVPIQSVQIFSGDEGTSSSFAQNYTLTGMETATVVPEPSSLGMLSFAAALIGIGVVRRGRVRRWPRRDSSE